MSVLLNWPIPGRFVGSTMGGLRKVCKLTLLQYLEKGLINQVSKIDFETVTVIDGMGLVRKKKTLGKISVILCYQFSIMRRIQTELCLFDAYL